MLIIRLFSVKIKKANKLKIPFFWYNNRDEFDLFKLFKQLLFSFPIIEVYRYVI